MSETNKNPNLDSILRVNLMKFPPENTKTPTNKNDEGKSCSKSSSDNNNNKAGSPCLFALGYYDRITFDSFEATAKEIKATTDIDENCQSILLIPSKTKNEHATLEGRNFGALTFFTINETKNENENISLFDTATEIQDLLVDKFEDKGSIFRAYVTANASAIAVISSPPKDNTFLDFYSKYFSFINESTANKKSVFSKILNSYTTFFFSDLYCENNDIEDQNAVDLFMIIARKLDEKHEDFVTFLNEHFEPNSESDTIKFPDHGFIPGAGDYFLFLKNYSLKNLITKLKDEKKIGKFCHSIHTTIVFDYNYTSSDKNNADETQKTLDETQKTLDKIIYPPDLELKKRRFESLDSSPFTKWAYNSYKDIVDQFLELYKETINFYENPNKYNKNLNKPDLITLLNDESCSFFSTLFDVLEALLDSGVYFSISPGYRKINFNTIPRIILCYQKMINDYAKKWDEYNGDKNRKHIFLLSPQNNMKIKASMYFQDLPPDKRLINIKVPIQEAYQPELTIPFLLHEVGHYIGVRLKISERPDVFIKLTVQKFFDHILTDFFDKIEDDYCKKESLTSSLLLSFFSEYNSLFKHIEKWYAISKNESIQKIQNESKKSEIKAQYLSEMRKLVTHIYKEILKEYPHIISEIQESLYNDICSDISLYEKFKNLYKNKAVNKKIQETIQQTLTNIYSSKNFITESEDLLGEVAADVFMVRTCNMNEDNYICLVFEQLVYETNCFSTLLNAFKDSPDGIIRTLAIWNILHKNPNSTTENSEDLSKFETKRLEVIKEYVKNYITNSDVGKKVKESYTDFKKWIKDKHEELENAEEESKHQKTVYRDFLYTFNSYFLVRDYVEKLYNDERYKALCNNKNDSEVRKQADKLRDIYTNACKRRSGSGDKTLADIYKLLYGEKAMVANPDNSDKTDKTNNIDN